MLKYVYFITFKILKTADVAIMEQLLLLTNIKWTADWLTSVTTDSKTNLIPTITIMNWEPRY